MADSTQALLNFIEKAVRNWKYTNATGNNLRHAVKAVDAVLQEDEKKSIKLLQERADAIIQRIDIKTPNKFTASSLMTIKSRLLRTIEDYSHYGTDPTKMAGWSPKLMKKNNGSGSKAVQKATTAKRGKVIDATIVEGVPDQNVPMFVGSSSVNLSVKMQSLDLPLKNDRSVVLYYPTDISVGEAEKIAMVLKGIAALTEE